MIGRAVIIACAVVALAACKKGGEITITVKNDSSVAVEGVELRWESHQQRIGTMKSGETKNVTMKPQPESGLRIGFNLPSGQHVDDTFDVLYREDARATITVTIRDGGEVSFHDPAAGPP